MMRKLKLARITSAAILTFCTSQQSAAICCDATSHPHHLHNILCCHIGCRYNTDAIKTKSGGNSTLITQLSFLQYFFVAITLKMSSLKFAVVKFSDNSSSIIPSCWLNFNSTKCKWPQKCTSAIIKRCPEPEEDWPIFDVEVLRSYSNF